MASHAYNRIAVGSSVLDLQTLHSVRVIAGPCLRRIIEHSRVKPGASARAGFKQDMREIADQPFIQRIYSQNMPVEYLPLPVSRKGRTVTLRDAAVHIPFDIRDFCISDHLPEHAIDTVHNLRSGKVEYALMPAQRTGSVRYMKDPVRMRPVEVGIRIHHLRLDPDTELHPQILDLLRESPYPFREDLLRRHPVSQAGAVISP